MSAERHPLHLVFQIGLAIEHLNQKLEAKVGISVTQWSVLKRLIDSPATSPLQLARSVGIRPSTLTQGLKRLKKKDYLFIGTDPLDRRKKILSITRKGKEVLERADEHLLTVGAAEKVSRADLRRIRDQIGLFA
jgi:DNA-binding MarR family transcriptional regulator